MSKRPHPTGTPPLIGVSCCEKEADGARFHAVGRKYVDAIPGAVGGLPLLIPALGDDPRDPHALDIPAVLDRLDGLLLTGSPSNLHPGTYGLDDPDAPGPHDPARDATTLPLARAALEAGVPVLAICRGLQELNVALGGTLSPKVQDLPDRFDHRARKDVDYPDRYRPAHTVRCADGGLLRRIVETAGGDPDRLIVNSLHQQAVDRPAPGVAVEAWAEDGTIEAVRVDSAPGFALAVQWHPEWRYWEDPVSQALFAAFGEAASARRDGRRDSPALGLAS